MSDDRLKIWLGFVKFLLGTVALGLVTTLIKSAIQERELELKEQEQIGQFLRHALDKDVGVRQRFAHYFSTVTRSDELRERWKEYSALVDEDYQETVKKKERLEAEVAQQNLDALERERLFARIAELEQALRPASPPSEESVPPRVYFHIRSENQRDKAQEYAQAISENFYNVPGIQRVDTGPGQIELRYFRQKEKDEAQAIAAVLKSLKVDVSLRYIRGYETSTLIRPRHYELWFFEEPL
jgi:hypothetical protein